MNAMKKRCFVLAAAAVVLCMSGMGMMSGKSLAAEPGWSSDMMGWTYQREDGTVPKNEWQQIDGSWYYFDREGIITTGWKTIGNEAYFFTNSGDLARGWCYNSSEERWYYFNEDGTRKTEWMFFEDNWYYFNSRGQMVSDGYTTINGERYYFYDDGRMAANKYVGTFYIGDNGLRDPSHDIKVEGKKDGIPSDEKDGITQAMANIPSSWVKDFLDNGWEIIYYTDKEYFSAPDSGDGIYYVKFKLDTSYRKLKLIDPDCLIQGFGEYIGYASGVYDNDSQDGADLMMEQHAIADLIDLPSYYAGDIQFYFGSLCKSYLEFGVNREFQEKSPIIYEILNKILYSASSSQRM